MRHIRSWAPQIHCLRPRLRHRMRDIRIQSSPEESPEKSNRRSAMKTALCIFLLSLSASGHTVSFTTPKNYFGGKGCAYSIVGDWNGER
jgi:hypothetical protein